MSRVYTVRIEDGMVTEQHIEELANTLADIPDLRLLVIDPVASYLGRGSSQNDETDVRSALNPLVALAEQQKFAIIGVKHANKDPTSAMADRVSGSRAWTALPRAVTLCGTDNDKVQEEHHTYGGIISTKGNLSGLVRPWAWEIENGVFRFVRQDITITGERLLPKAKSKGREDNDN
jgi:hypothetical protein